MIKWDYLVEDIYEDSDFIPATVPPGRLMTEDERAESYGLFAVGKKVVKAWTLTKYMHARGKQGWELVQVAHLSTGNAYEPGYWKCFFKRVRAAAEEARAPV
jgi:hypothetical protein